MIRQSGISRNGSIIARGHLARNRPLVPQGRIAKAWRFYRNAQFTKDMDENGLIECQDYKIGLARCGVKDSEMDLHHTEGREGDLLFNRSKMVWLTRNCHGLAHR